MGFFERRSRLIGLTKLREKLAEGDVCFWEFFSWRFLGGAGQFLYALILFSCTSQDAGLERCRFERLIGGRGEFFGRLKCAWNIGPLQADQCKRTPVRRLLRRFLCQLDQGFFGCITISRG